MEIKSSVISNLEHILFAFLVASVLTIADYQGILYPLDSAMLKIGAAGFSRAPIYPGPEKFGASGLVLTLSDSIFESHFEQQSPLDRAKLATLLGNILAKNPRTLAVDLDLSPGLRWGENGDTVLKDLLISAAGSGSTEVILISPIPVTTAAMFLVKKRWMADLCAAGIKFALPTVYSTQGAVIRYDQENPLLGNVAGGADRNLCTELEDSRIDYADLLYALGYEQMTTREAGKKAPLNFAFVDQLESFQIDKVEEIRRLPDLAGKDVFLGSGYGVGDKFITPRGVFDGVYLHAAAFYTNANPIRHVQHSRAYWIDVGLGYALAVIFSFFWGRYFLSRKHYATAMLWWLVNVAALFSLSCAAIRLAPLLLLNQLWLNPGVLLISVWVKAYAAKDHAGSHNPVRYFRSYSENRSVSGFLNCFIRDSVLVTKLGVITYGLFLALHH